MGKSSRYQRGGESTNAMEIAKVGGVDAQFNRVFNQAGPFGNVQSNALIGTSGQGVVTSGIPSAANLARVQSAGRKRRGGCWTFSMKKASVKKSSRKGKGRVGRKSSGGAGPTRYPKGGNVAAIAQAFIPPATLLALQQTYRRGKGKKGKGTRRRGRR